VNPSPQRGFITTGTVVFSRREGVGRVSGGSSNITRAND
jgi:hypothetical protein